MARKYYVLMVRQEDQWALEFGDYTRADVQAELQDQRGHGVKTKDLVILTVQDDSQVAVDKAVEEFRSKQNESITA